jgi:hypothetical protein
LSESSNTCDCKRDRISGSDSSSTGVR